MISSYNILFCFLDILVYNLPQHTIMDLTILAIVFFGSNLLGMYNYVPFTNIHPMSTFIQRGIGSLQLTSTVYALQELGEAVFSGVQKEREQEAIKHALDEYMSARNNATFILPTRSESTTNPTVTTTTFVDMHGTIRSQAITDKVREHLHPNLDTHRGIVNAIWEALAFALLGFTILCIIWKELTKSHKSSPNDDPEKSSLSMIVEQLLKDRLSLPVNHGKQDSPVPHAAPTSNNSEFPGLLNQLTVWFSDQLKSSDNRLRDTFQSSERALASECENIGQQLEKLRNQQNAAVSQETISILLKDLGEFIEVQRGVSKGLAECHHITPPNIQAQINETKSYADRLENEKNHRNEFECEIESLKDDIGMLKIKLESCCDDSIKERLQALEDPIDSLKNATTSTSLNSEAIRKGIGNFREKQEELERRVDEIKHLDFTAKLTASEKNWGQSFQRMEDRMSRMESYLSDIHMNVQKYKQENDAANSANITAIENFEHCCKAAEKTLGERIGAVEKRIYNPGGKFRSDFMPKEISLEELARLFKNLREKLRDDLEWMRSRVTSVADNSDRVSRMENIMRDNSRYIGKCTEKLGIRFEPPGEDEATDQPNPMPAPVSDDTVQQKEIEPKEKITGSKGPTVDNSMRLYHGDSTQTHSPTESRPHTDQSLNSWTNFSKNAHGQEKIEADKRQSEEDNLRAQGKFTMPQVNLKETYIRGVPKDDEDYSQAEKTEHKIGAASPSVSGLSQSKWASPAQDTAKIPAPKDIKSSGLNQSMWASAPKTISTPTSKDTGTPKPENWAETPPFIPGSKQETPTTGERSHNIPTSPRTPTIQSRRRRKSSSGLRESTHAPPPTSNVASRPGQSDAPLMQRVRKETSASFSGFPKSKPVQSPSGTGKGKSTVPIGLQGSIHAQLSTDVKNTPETSSKPASPVESKDKQKPKEKKSDLSGINQSRWADK